MTCRSPPKKKASFVDVDEDAEAAASSAPTNGSFGGYQVSPAVIPPSYVAASVIFGDLQPVTFAPNNSAQEYMC